jgi:hypothetical protein
VPFADAEDGERSLALCHPHGAVVGDIGGSAQHRELRIVRHGPAG